MTTVSVGTLLREGRLRQRLSVAECAKRTHISARYIEALEEEHWDSMPSESHREGFLGLYARFLGVSSDEAIQLYRQSRNSSPTKESVKEAKARARAPFQWGVVSWQKLTLAAVLLLGLGWGIYHAIGSGSEQRTLAW